MATGAAVVSRDATDHLAHRRERQYAAEMREDAASRSSGDDDGSLAARGLAPPTAEDQTPPGEEIRASARGSGCSMVASDISNEKSEAPRCAQ